jgi:hypothetical protein|eukprot:COSAG02_NODE_119_length_35335_cov_12.823192_10_plen_77_part_00
MLTKLLVGDAVELKPDSELRFPPTVAGENGRRYDTVTGTTNGSKVYVVYENGTCQEALCEHCSQRDASTSRAISIG